MSYDDDYNYDDDFRRRKESYREVDRREEYRRQDDIQDEQRLRESNDFLNRQDDQSDFENEQTKRTDDVYKGIIKKDDFKINSALGIVPSVSTDTDSDYSSSSEEKNKPPTVEEQFAEYSSRLITTLELSKFLPTYVTHEWIRKIKKINPLTGLLILDELFADYQRALEEYKPQRDILDMAIGKTMQFDVKMQDIKRELDQLRAIFLSVLFK